MNPINEFYVYTVLIHDTMERIQVRRIRKLIRCGP
jgi:hypothetical protein